MSYDQKTRLAFLNINEQTPKGSDFRPLIAAEMNEIFSGFYQLVQSFPETAQHTSNISKHLEQVNEDTAKTIHEVAGRR